VSPSLRDQDSHLFKTTGTITVLYALDSRFGQETARQKTLHRMLEGFSRRLCVVVRNVVIL